jgi:diguanylate cyclase (GGDEF)-like protein
LQADPVKFRHLSRADGLPCDNIDKLLEANDGRIWASSDCGVVMIDPNSLTIRAFGPADGMAVTAHWNSSGGRTADGTLLFGGIGGVTVVHPDRRADWTYRPAVVITAIRVGESSRPAADALMLLPGDHSLQVEFAALDYSAPDRNRYAYRLVGFDDDWISTDAAHRLAAYTNLPPGNYSLLLRGSNRDGVWSDPPITLLVTVLPAWYQTIWCMIAEILAAAGAICAVILYRTRMLHQRRVQLEREVAERTQELGVSAKTLQLSNAELERLAHHDPLTGLGNRRRFFQVTADLLVQARRHHRPCCVMMVDLDHFKRINDNFGHGGGDETLRATARCLVESLRQVDVVARFGGEELAVFLPETAMPEAFLVAERFRQSLESVNIQYEGAVIRVTASIGIACWVEPETGIEPALRRADAALYRVKNAGRNNVAIEPETTFVATTTGCTVA